MNDKEREEQHPPGQEETPNDVLNQSADNLKKVARNWKYIAGAGCAIVISTFLYGGADAVTTATRILIATGAALTGGFLAFNLFEWLQSPGKPARSPEARRALSGICTSLIALAILGLSASLHFLAPI